MYTVVQAELRRSCGSSTTRRCDANERTASFANAVTHADAQRSVSCTHTSLDRSMCQLAHRHNSTPLVRSLSTKRVARQRVVSWIANDCWMIERCVGNSMLIDACDTFKDGSVFLSFLFLFLFFVFFRSIVWRNSIKARTDVRSGIKVTSLQRPRQNPPRSCLLPTRH